LEDEEGLQIAMVNYPATNCLRAVKSYFANLHSLDVATDVVVFLFFPHLLETGFCNIFTEEIDAGQSTQTATTN
jgi:hypothetical protein